MTKIRGRTLFMGILLTLAFSTLPLRARSPFCSDSGCTATRQFFHQLCDYIVQNRSDVPKIYTGGYYMRTLVAGYEIFGEERYLGAAITYADGLLNKQSPRGYWGTGYGDIFLADTGSAVGLFIQLYKHVDKARQEKYLDAVRRYVTAIQQDGLIHPSGALSGGWRTAKDGTILGPLGDEYTISSGLTGGEVFAWMYHITGDKQYQQVAFNALHWILGTERQDGVIPYVNAFEGYDLAKKGDPLNDYHLWEALPYCTSSYVGEGVIAFDLYSDQPEWKAEIRRAMAPHIQFLLRTQNPDGSWGKPEPPEKTMCSGKMDFTRSPGIVNLLIWYDENVHRDRRIVRAVQAFDRFVLNPEQAKTFGLLNAGATLDNECSNSNTVTSLTGRAIADILDPDSSSKR
jgi:hypothetical protein